MLPFHSTSDGCGTAVRRSRAPRPRPRRAAAPPRGRRRRRTGSPARPAARARRRRRRSRRSRRSRRPRPAPGRRPRRPPAAAARGSARGSIRDGKHVVGDPVDAAGEERHAVDDEGEPGAVRVGRRVQLDGAEADRAAATRPAAPVRVQERQLDVVQRLFAVAARPPQLARPAPRAVRPPRSPRRQRHARARTPPTVACSVSGASHPGAARRPRATRRRPAPVVDGHQRAHPGEPGRRPALQPHRPPDPGGHQGRAPVPAEVAGHLADVLVRLGVGGGPVAQLRRAPPRPRRRRRRTARTGCARPQRPVTSKR